MAGGGDRHYAIFPVSDALKDNRDESEKKHQVFLILPLFLTHTHTLFLIFLSSTVLITAYKTETLGGMVTIFRAKFKLCLTTQNK